MVDKIINCEASAQADVLVLSANYDVTSSFGKGADKGPQAIIKCLDNQVEFYERFTGTEPACNLKISHQDLGEMNKLTPEEAMKKIEEAYGVHYKAGKFVVVIGGDHSVSNGPFLSIASQEKAEDITILQIDAHFDLRESDADYNPKPHGKFSHSAVIRRGVELGFKAVQVGIRAYSKEELEFATQNTTFFEWGRGTIPTVKEIIDSIKTEKVYLTIDVDGIDPTHMPSTGTPVPGGLEWNYTVQLMRELFKNKNVIGADIVEVAPREGDNMTEYAAAQLLYNIIAFKHAK
jgi:agmatinase